jgi:hypothetical protein
MRIARLKMVRRGKSQFAVCPRCGGLMVYDSWDRAWWCAPPGGCNLKAKPLPRGRRYSFRENPIHNELYESFHGNPPMRLRRVRYEPPEGPLVKLGVLAQISYRPEFPSRHKGTEFYHTAGDTGEKVLKSNLILATDQDGRNLYLIKMDPESRYPHVTNRGIIG